MSAVVANVISYNKSPEIVCHIVLAHNWQDFYSIMHLGSYDPRNPFMDHIHIIPNRRVEINQEIYYYFRII